MQERDSICEGASFSGNEKSMRLYRCTNRLISQITQFPETEINGLKALEKNLQNTAFLVRKMEKTNENPCSFFDRTLLPQGGILLYPLGCLYRSQP
jgi:hypothetical protein